LFGQDFEDPLTWLLAQVGELPLPKRSKRRAICNPLILLAVPSKREVQIITHKLFCNCIFKYYYRAKTRRKIAVLRLAGFFLIAASSIAK